MTTFLSLFYHAWRTTKDQPISLVLLMLLPVGVAFIPPHENMLPFGLYIYGLVNLFSAFTLAKPIMEDRIKGQLVRIIASPVRYGQYLLSHLSLFLLVLTVQNLSFLTLVNVRWGSEMNSTGMIFALYFCYNMMSIAMALAWNALFRSYNLSFALYSGFASILCLITGVTIPLFLFPERLRQYVSLLPTYWLSNGLDAIHERQTETMLLAPLILLVYAALFMVIGGRKKYV